MSIDKNSPFASLMNHPAAAKAPMAESATTSENTPKMFSSPLSPVGRRILPTITAAAPASTPIPPVQNVEVEENDVPELSEDDMLDSIVDDVLSGDIFSMNGEEEDVALTGAIANLERAVNEALHVGAASDATEVVEKTATASATTDSDDSATYLTGAVNEILMNELLVDQILNTDSDSAEVETSPSFLSAISESIKRDDPHEPLHHSDEFVNSESLAHMVDKLRDINDEKIRTTIMNILPQIFGAKSITAENEIAIYMAENAQFRDWCMALYRLADVSIEPISRSAVMLDNQRMFLSRAPRMVDMHQAMIHAVTVFDNWKAAAAKQTENGLVQSKMQERLNALQAQLNESEKQRNASANTVGRLQAEMQKMQPLDSFRIQWQVTAKNSVTGQPMTRTAYLALRDEDVGTIRPDGLWPAKHYVAVYKDADAHIFKSMETAFRTIDFMKSQSTRIVAQGGQFGAFNLKFLSSAVVTQWAMVHHTTRPTTVKVN